MSRRFSQRLIARFVFGFLTGWSLLASDILGSEEIDWPFVRTTVHKLIHDQRLSDLEEDYLNDLTIALKNRNDQLRAASPRTSRQAAARLEQARRDRGPSSRSFNFEDQKERNVPRDSWGMIPLNELGEGKYRGKAGGLYGDGSNQVPPHIRLAARKKLKQIQPLDRDGKPSPDGKIGFISLGMSNVAMEFETFVQMANADPKKESHVVVLNCAQGGQDTLAYADIAVVRATSPWRRIPIVCRANGISPKQIQVAWLKQATRQPHKWGGQFPEHADQYRDLTVIALNKLNEFCPNIKIVYLSSRTYGGWARTKLSHEPYAYEYGFATRDLILSQHDGSNSKLNHDPTQGQVRAPLTLWGPYLWADGITARQDGFAWQRRDFAGDGIHPTESGKTKVARALLNFLHHDPLARSWYRGLPDDDSVNDPSAAVSHPRQ